MDFSELATELRLLNVNTSGSVCNGCMHARDCETNGCNVINFTADKLEKVDSALRSIKTLYDDSLGTMHSTLRDVLRLFDPAYGPPPKAAHDVYDFQLCADAEELKQTIGHINDHGLDLISVTQDASGVYTVFFRRPLRE